MKVYRFYILAQVFTCGLVGVATWMTLIWSPSMTTTLLLLLPLFLVPTAVGFVLAARVVTFIKAIEQLTNNVNPRVHIPWEFDDQMASLNEATKRLHQFTHAAREQSREISQLMRDLGAAREGLGPRHIRQMLSQLAKTTDANVRQVLHSTREIELSTRDIAAGADDQSEAVSRTTTYAEQMSNNIESITNHAQAARSAVLEARQSSDEALKIIQQLQSGMSRIRSHVEANGRKLQSLGEHSNTISSIVGTIGAISSRTDMLALNASIESVRAGEHGRGFAFVAEEVRKLAEQAAQATQEIAGLVESIRLETQESITVMGEEQDQLETELCRVHEAASAMDRIHRISNDSAERVQEITHATQQQLQLIRDLVLAVERISKVARTSRNRADNAQFSTRALVKAAKFVDASISPLRDPNQPSEQLPFTESPDAEASAFDEPALATSASGDWSSLGT